MATKTLTGKSAIVTGSGGGIGRAVAMELAEQGAKVLVNDIGRAPDGSSMADKVVEEIKKAGGLAAPNYDSVATMAGGKNIVSAALSNFGRLDILVGCAGNYKQGPILDATEEDWDAVITVHVKGHFSTIQAAAREMAKQKSGRIINIASNAGFDFNTARAVGLAYATAKAGILGMTAALSANLKQYGITVNCILPGAVTNLFPYATRSGFGSKKREGPDYVAPLIAYLSTDLAQNVTGQYFYSGGGEICLYNKPFQMPGPHVFVRKIGKWTVEELSEVVPSMIG